MSNAIDRLRLRTDMQTGHSVDFVASLVANYRNGFACCIRAHTAADVFFRLSDGIVEFSVHACMHASAVEQTTHGDEQTTSADEQTTPANDDTNKVKHTQICENTKNLNCGCFLLCTRSSDDAKTVWYTLFPR